MTTHDTFMVGGSWRSTAAPTTSTLLRKVQVWEGRFMCHANLWSLRMRSIMNMPPRIVVWFD